MGTSHRTGGAGPGLAFRCRSHALRDVAVVAAILALIGSFVAHASSPESGITPAMYARAAAPSPDVVAMRSPADACTCP